MPGGNGTGPQGLGPKTGRAAGYCAGYPAPGYMNPIPGRRGFGFGQGQGRGRGWGRGFGRGFGWGRWAYPGYAYGYPYAPEVAPVEEAEALKEQAKIMQEEISAINGRIKELESLAKSQRREK